MTAEEKALEAYPILMDATASDCDFNEEAREAYIEGYTQAYKDFLDKACKWLEANIIGMGQVKNDMIKNFKKAMEE